MKSFSKNVEKLIGEYVPKEIYSFYAVPNSGKTLFLLQEAYSLVKQGVRVLWIDTEGGFNGLANSWWGKWGFDGKNIFYVNYFDYEELMRWLGWNVTIEYGKNKMEILGGEPIKKEQTVYADDFGKLRSNTAIIVDSISSLLRLRFSDSSQNYPVRATATGYLFYALMKLANKVNAPIITSHHASLNPTNPYVNLGLMRGGNTVAYYSKNIIYIEKPRKKLLEDYRKFWGVRTAVAKEWGIFTWLKIDDSGYRDVDDKEVDSILSGGGGDAN
jgi:hypothetical protein